MLSLQPRWIVFLFLSAVSMTLVFIIEFWVLMAHFGDGDKQQVAIGVEPNNIDRHHNNPKPLSVDGVAAVRSYTTTLTDPVPPLVLISRGCSGSSFLMAGMAWGLVMSHTKRNVYHYNFTKHESGSEYLARWNSIRYNWTLAESDPFRASNEMVLNTYKDIVIDSEPPQMMAVKVVSCHLTPGVGHGLRKLGARIVMTYRRNKLGLTICRIRDCFVKPDVGVPVFENGSISKLCFDRRKHKETKTLARINATLFDEKMRHRMKTWGCSSGLKGHDLHDLIQERMGLKANDYPTLAEESLTAFEYEKEGSHAFVESVESWKRLLRGWGIVPQEALIMDQMRKVGIGSRLRSSTKQSLENCKDVEEVVRRWVVESSASSNSQTCDWSWMLN